MEMLNDRFCELCNGSLISITSEITDIPDYQIVMINRSNQDNLEKDCTPSEIPPYVINEHAMYQGIPNFLYSYMYNVGL